MGEQERGNAMQITFFVGNGFDIACGINSSYTDFYSWYCKQEKSDKEHVNRFRETIDNDIKAGKKNWADFEVALGKYTMNFTKENAQQFIDCYEDAHEKLIEYLKKESEYSEDEMTEERVRTLSEGLKNFYAELPPKEKKPFDTLFAEHKNENIIMKFISYNYTDVLDKCIASVAREPFVTWTGSGNHRYSYFVATEITHAHGCLLFHPVFGVNDESQIANKDLMDIPNFAKLMVKPRCVDALGELWHDEVNKAIDDSAVICIFGMSMGITDSIWFERIMGWLQANENRQLIIYWHTQHPSEQRSNWRFLDNISKAQKKITDYSNLTDDKIETINGRIHVIENTKSVLQIELKKGTTMN